MDEHPKSPAQASREGLEDPAASHHPSTGKTPPPHDPADRPVTPAGDLHRGGPLPNEKK